MIGYISKRNSGNFPKVILTRFPLRKRGCLYNSREHRQAKIDTNFCVSRIEGIGTRDNVAAILFLKSRWGQRLFANLCFGHIVVQLEFSDRELLEVAYACLISFDELKRSACYDGGIASRFTAATVKPSRRTIFTKVIGYQPNELIITLG